MQTHLFLLLAACLVAGCSFKPARVEFTFEVPEADSNPFAREVWATVVKPSGTTIRVPVFWVEGERFAARIFGDERGRYRLTSVEEGGGESLVQHPLSAVEQERATIPSASTTRFIRIDPDSPQHFAFDDGTRYVPIGGNVPWLPSPEDSLEKRLLPYYQERFGQFADAGLNWVRIWMVHFSRLNLDWLEEDRDEQPPPGQLETEVAERWDRILAMAESTGVYVQMVLQHHGQYSTETNPKWQFNPWNAVHPDGFLEQPADFFTSEKARRLTKQKYRYIVARWGYSPAVMAWELFNEVHWVDAMRYAFDEKSVTAWHDEMAGYLRAIDAHEHLVTTSISTIKSPIYARMDYLQPHIYAVNMIDNMRYVDPAYAEIGKPVFFGEFGDDHMPLTEAQKKTGVTIIPPIWAGIMGSLHIPPQTWFVERLVETGNLGKLEAVARFLKATRIAERDDLAPFSPAVESPEMVPLFIRPGFVWMDRPELIVDVATDGSASASQALVPGVLIADSLGRKRGFAEQVTFRVNFPQADTVSVRLRLREKGTGGTTAEAALDDRVVARHTWLGADSTTEGRAARLTFVVPAGPHTIVVRNATGPAWFHFDRLDTGFDVPVIAAAGKRNDDFIALWIWNREGVFATEPVIASAATLVLNDVPPGSWRIAWWDTDRGVSVSNDRLEHDGGRLRLDTPAVDRHTAVVMTRTDIPS